MRFLGVLGIFIIHSTVAFAQQPEGILKICENHRTSENSESLGTSMKMMSVNGQSLAILDRGFCNEYLKGLNAPPAPQPPYLNITPQWKLTFYMSHSFTTYFDSDVSFRSSRYNVDIKDYQWAERSSREYFLPKTWKQPGNNPLQVLDEPTNTFMLCLENGKHNFCLSAFHPKFLQAGGQVRYMNGTIDGVAVDGYAPVNKPFDGYDQTPGESELVRNQNTHRQMTFELGYGYRFNLISGRAGSISFVPSIGLGVMTGENFTVMVKENLWWDFDEYKDKYRIQGFGGSITNRIEYNTPRNYFGIFYENKLAYYSQSHGFLDGTQTYKIGFMGNSVGMKFNIPMKRKRSRP